MTKKSSNYEQRLLQATATPGLFAQTVSKGRWKMYRHHALIDDALVRLAKGTLRRLIIQAPPRHGKSEISSRYFPCWVLGTYPDRDVILASATDELAAEYSQFARDTLAEFGPSVFGVRLRGDTSARDRWMLEQGGSMRAAGIGGSIMGRGANLLILDDYFKNVEEALSETTRRKHHQWYHSTFKTRGTPDCSILIIATRWHKKDLIGLLLEEQERGGDQWEVINLPAIAEEDDQLGRQPGEALWPEQWPLAALEQKRNSYVASGYEWQWEALYQQNPPETLDAEYPKEYFEGDLFFDEWPTKLAIKTMALDPSVGKTAKSDYSAIVQLGVSPDGLLYVDADLQRRDVFRTASDAIDICRPFSPVAFGVETIAFQQVLSPIIAERSKAAGFMLPLYEINHHHQDKKSRIRARLTPYLAKRQFRFKRHSPGVNLLLEQLKGFPATKYDDGPDALEMAVRLAQDMWANQPAEQEYYEYERVLC